MINESKKISFDNEVNNENKIIENNENQINEIKNEDIFENNENKNNIYDIVRKK